MAGELAHIRMEPRRIESLPKEPVEEQGDILLYGRLMSQMHGYTQNVMEQSMMNNDAEKSSRRQYRIYWAVGTLINALSDIARKEIMKHSILLLKKHIRHRMAF